jgi:hypothetical protein
MTNMEKAQQIGELVQRREEQKKALGHLKQKGEKVAAAYGAFARSRDRWGVDSGKLYIRSPRDDEGIAHNYLLSREELARHVQELQDADKAFKETSQLLLELGISF